MKKTKKSLAITMLAIAVFCAVGFTSRDNATVSGDCQVKGNGTLNGYAYVNLGLPSGTLWATCNVGAEKPEDRGSYFAWGETERRYSIKDMKNGNNYKYGKGRKITLNALREFRLTKYCSQKDLGFRGFTDNLTTLEPCDDPATFYWGEGWRTPTLQEWQELINNTTNRYDQIGLLSGWRFYGKNGNSIFLPAAGSWQDEFLNDDLCGCYWSSSLLSDNPIYAAGYEFCGMEADLCGFFRNAACTIRSVCSASK